MSLFIKSPTIHWHMEELIETEQQYLPRGTIV